MRHYAGLVLRSSAAALMIALGWCGQLLLYTLIAPGASAGDIRFWSAYSGAYCAAALVLVGLPLAMKRPSTYMARPVRSILLAGAAGAAMTALPPAAYLFVLTVPLGFITGAFAMWGFIAIVSLFAVES